MSTFYRLGGAAAATAFVLTLGFGGVALAQDPTPPPVANAAAVVRGEIEALGCENLAGADVRLGAKIDALRDNDTVTLPDLLGLRTTLATKINALKSTCVDETPAPTTNGAPTSEAAPTTQFDVPETGGPDVPQVQRVPRGSVATGGR